MESSAGQVTSGQTVTPRRIATVAPISYRNTIALLLIERDGERCSSCGEILTEQDRQIDHVVERSKGGTDDLSNLRLLHKACHRRRHGWAEAKKPDRQRSSLDSAAVKVTLPTDLIRRLESVASSRGVGLSTLVRMLLHSALEPA